MGKRKGKGILQSDYLVKNQREGYFILLDSIKQRAVDDEYYYKNHRAPPGQQGHSKTCKEYYSILKKDPIKEWENSLVLQYIKVYYEKVKKIELQKNHVFMKGA